jgi:aspyridone synthetase (hybrid polyketide synthase/nonribosomal peptide synthetase)
MMQLPPDSVNVNIPLIDLGCDSLLAAEIRTWFLRELRMDIPVLKVLSGDTVAQICEYATKKFLALKLNEAEKERAAASTRVEDAVTVEANQPLSSVSINQDREKLDSSDSSDSKCDTSSDSNSEKMHSLGLSTPPSLLIGSETPPSVLTTSFNISKDGSK